MRTVMSFSDPVFDVVFHQDPSRRTPSKSHLPALQQSPLYQKLRKPFPFSNVNLIIRLSQFAEIEHAFADSYVRQLVMIMLEQNWTPQGFSLSHDPADINPVFNAIQTTLLLRMGLPDHDLLRVGINWIMTHQPMKYETGPGHPQPVSSQELATRIDRIVKSLIALSEYQQKYPGKWTHRMQEKLEAGLEYLLSNELFFDQGENKSMRHLVFPFYPATNLLEILRLMRDQNRLKHSSCQKALHWLQVNQKEDLCWYSSDLETYPGWVHFDTQHEPSLWITSLAKDILTKAA